MRTIEDQLAEARAIDLFVRFIQQTSEFWEVTLVLRKHIYVKEPVYGTISRRGPTIGEAIENALNFAKRILANIGEPTTSEEAEARRKSASPPEPAPVLVEADDDMIGGASPEPTSAVTDDVEDLL